LPKFLLYLDMNAPTRGRFVRESRLRGGFLPPRIHPPRGRQATRRASYGRGDLSP